MDLTNLSVHICHHLLPNKCTAVGPGISYSDWQNASRDQSNREPYTVKKG